MTTVTGEQLRAAMLRATTSGRSVAEELGLAAPTGAAPGRRWSAAVPRECAAGHRHASKLEARTCAILAAQCGRAGTTLYQQMRVPLLTLAPSATGRPFYATMDFAIVKGGQLQRLVDAKGRVSREWARGAAAVHSTLGLPIEELTSQDVARLEAEELLRRASAGVSQ